MVKLADGIDRKIELPHVILRASTIQCHYPERNRLEHAHYEMSDILRELGTRTPAPITLGQEDKIALIKFLTTEPSQEPAVEIKDKTSTSEKILSEIFELTKDQKLQKDLQDSFNQGFVREKDLDEILLAAKKGEDVRELVDLAHNYGAYKQLGLIPAGSTDFLSLENLSLKDLAKAASFIRVDSLHNDLAEALQRGLMTEKDYQDLLKPTKFNELFPEYEEAMSDMPYSTSAPAFLRELQKIKSAEEFIAKGTSTHLIPEHLLDDLNSKDPSVRKTALKYMKLLERHEDDLNKIISETNWSPKDAQAFIESFAKHEGNLVYVKSELQPTLDSLKRYEHAIEFANSQGLITDENRDWFERAKLEDLAPYLDSVIQRDPKGFENYVEGRRYSEETSSMYDMESIGHSSSILIPIR